MSPPTGSQFLRGWKPSAYQAAVVLSGSSAVLGLGREVLILRHLGLSAANDALQFALSITYTIALLGDPLRLTALNLLPRRVGVRLWLVVGAGILVAAAAVTTLYALYAGGNAGIPPQWFLLAGIAGAGNLFLAWTLPRRQRSGPFLPVHAVTVMPNIFMVAGLLVPADSDQSFAARVVALFLLAPVLQLAALAMLSRYGDHPELAAPPSLAEGLKPMGRHAIGAVGGQATQFFIRRALFAGPGGALSGFTTVLRVTDTLRAIFVDTYIASRVKRWAAGERATSAVIDGSWLSPLALLGICGAGLLVALGWSGRPGTLLTPSAAMPLIGAYLILALRVRYQLLNTSAQPVRIVNRMAALEAVAAVAIGVLGAIPGVPVAVLPWVGYVAKPAAGLQVISVELEGDQPLAPED